MTPAAAEALAVKLHAQWPRTASLEVWRDDIADLDEGAVGTAFVQLRRTLTHPPTIADFRRSVAVLDTHDASTRTVCHECDNTGWVEAPELVLDRDSDNPRRYSQVQPCRYCPDGEPARMSSVWTKRGDAA